MNQELRSANEEIQSSNEELQSTNEELETAKEELQSTNEELTTLNDELENRNQEVGLANNDLINLLTSVEIPILMLDAKLRIRRFNPIAQRKLNLVAADIGRPIDDINTRLQLDHLDQMVREVIESLEVREIKVKDRSGRTQSLRIRPYRTTDNKIDGAVLVLIDLEEFAKRVIEGAQRLRTRICTASISARTNSNCASSSSTSSAILCMCERTEEPLRASARSRQSCTRSEACKPAILTASGSTFS
jgi:two-component system, chemotaxis family, CheB/CheR fusion protein